MKTKMRLAFCMMLLAASSQALEVYFMRHGETVWNRSKVLQGAIAYPDLTEKGVRVAEASARGLSAAGIRFDRIYASPLKRAFHTAEIVAGTSGCKPVVDGRLREMCYGKYDGVRYAKGDYPDDNLRRFFEEPESYVPTGAGAESFDDVGARLRSFLNDELLPLEGKVDRVLCVAHSLILKTLVRELAGSTASAAARKPIQRNCCVHVLGCENGRFVLKETGRLFYDPTLFDMESVPLVVARCGADDLDGCGSEVSPAAFSNAVAAACDVVKLDVQGIRDRVMVTGREAEHAVRLDDALEIVKTQPQFWLDFRHFDPEVAEKALLCFSAAGIDFSRIMVATFDRQALAYFKERHPKIRRICHINWRMLPEGGFADGNMGQGKASMLNESMQIVLDYCAQYGLYGVNMPAASMTADGARFLHGNGVKWLSLYLIQNATVARDRLQVHADAFVTDHVQEVRQGLAPHPAAQ